MLQDDPAAKLAAELLRSPIAAADNPILKLVWNAQYGELVAKRVLDLEDEPPE